MKNNKKILCLLVLAAILTAILALSVCAQGVWPSTAKVEEKDGRVCLTVDGKELIPIMSFGYLGEYEYPKYYRTIEYSKHSQNQIYMVCADNDFTSEATKQLLDEEINRFLELDSDAYFIIRMSAFAAGEWSTQTGLYPNDESQYAIRYDGTKSGSDIGLGWLTLNSPLWRDRIEYNYTKGIEWLSTRPYANRIIGFQCGNGTYAEWCFVHHQNGNLDDYSEASRNGFREWLKEKYGTNKALQTAWYDDKVTFENAEIPTPEERFDSNDGLFHNVYTGSSKVVDYNEYYNWCYYSSLEHIGKIVHEKSDDSLLAGYLYGYYFGSIGENSVNSGHMGWTDMLKSENIDFVSATNYYLNERALGGNHISGSVIESLTANGKLYIMEDDTRTYLSPVSEAEVRTNTYEETLAALRRNYAITTVRDQGMYFMDMDGSGWYNDSDLWEQIGEMRRLWAAMNFSSANGGYKPEIALVVDDQSSYYVDTEEPRTASYSNEQLREIRKTGISYGTYMKCDIDKIPESAKLIIMANTFYMDKEDIENINALKADGKVIIWCRAPGYITDEGQSVENISKLTGIMLESIDTVENEMTRITNETHPVTAGAFVSQFGMLGEGRRVFAVKDDEATALGVYKGSEYVSFAIKEFENWVSVFAGTGELRRELIVSIVKNYTDIHNYKPEGYNDRDGIEADGTFICYNPATIGHKVILLPEYSHVVDNINNISKGNSVNAISYEAKYKGDVGMFSIIPGVYGEVSVNSEEVTKSGKWETGGGALVSTTLGDTLTYTFKGTFVSVIASRGYDKGVIGYTIDGVEYPDVNFHTKEGLDAERCEYVLAQNLADREHTVVVTVKEPIEYAPETLNIKTDNPKVNTIHGNDIPSEYLTATTGADDYAYEMGVKFQVKVPGKITKARLLAVPAESGKHTVTLFDGAGRVVAGPFEWNISVSATSWCEYTFKKPIEIEAEKEYVLCITNTTGKNHYVRKDGFFFETAKDSVFILDDTSGRFGTTLGQMPTLNYNGTSYYRDLVFEFDKKLLVSEKTEKIDKNIVICGFGTVDSSNVVKVTKEERTAVVDSYDKDGSVIIKELAETEVRNDTPVAKSTKSTVLVNGVNTQFEAYEIEGYNYFKLRDFAYAVNGSAKQFEVTWDEEKNAIGLISGSAYTTAGGELTLGDGADKEAKKTTSAVIKDGVEVSFEAYEIGGYNYFKLRDMAKAFNIGITWDEITSTIGIDTSLDYISP